MTLSNNDDVIDSRDIIARIEELRAEHRLGALDPDDEQELQVLQDLAAEASASPDWEYGETLIRDTYFTQYAEDLANDIGAIDRDQKNRWPFTCISWEDAAEELQADYFRVDFDGEPYWIHS